MKSKKHLTLILCLLFVFSLCFTLSAYGASLSDVNNKIDQKQQELKEGEKEQQKVQGEIDKLTDKINGMQDEIDSIQSDINSTQSQIAETQIRLDELKKKVQKQNDDLNSRLRTMYMNDNTSFIEVVLNSGSISELLVNLELIKKIHKADKDMLAMLEEQHAAVESEEQALYQLKASLEANQSMVAEKQNNLEKNKAELNEKAKDIEVDNASLEKELGDLEAEARRLTAQIQSMGSKGKYGGSMIWPCGGSVSCEYGYRICPYHGYELHTGIDIAVGTGTAIHAASSGVVRQAYSHATYGKMVLIDNGGGIYTLYAHNSRLCVNAGQKVSQGDVIAYSGSTGNSTGPHCHFEVRKNGQPVNPRKYLG